MSGELVPADPIQGRIVGPSEPSPGRNQRQYVSPPPNRPLRLEYDGPAAGTIVSGSAYGAFCLDGPATGRWQVQIPPFRAIYPRRAVDVWTIADTDPDRMIDISYVTYDLHVLRMTGSESERRYRFWSSRPQHEIDPADALFLLIDAEPWQAQQCRVGMGLR